MTYNKPPPYERPNWATMNEGQRRYAMEQYNLALVRRGVHFDLPVLGAPEQTGNTEAQDDMNPSGISAGAKRPAQGAASGSAPPPKKKTTGAPGTGNNTDGGGPSESTGSGVIDTIPRGITLHNYHFIYTKTWKLLSYGVGDVMLLDNNAPGRLCLTSSLANIPWEYGFFYCSPAEWARLREFRSVRGVSCNIEVAQFNPRIAFETNSSTSSLATLNQNKFIRTAVGIRQHPAIICSDRDYRFDDTKNPMKPTAFDSTNAWTSRKELQENYYGVDNANAAVKDKIPAYATGHELALQRYLTIYAPQKGNAGFPPYNTLVSEKNAVDTVGQIVLKMEHTFANAPLSQSHDTALMEGCYEENMNLKIASGTSNKMTELHEISDNFIDGEVNQAQGHYIYAIDQSGKFHATSVFDSENFYTKFPMEQNGVFNKFPGTNHEQTCMPSVHVGVRAVPHLTTNATSIRPVEWADTQIYWTVKSTLICEASDEYNYILGKAYGKPTNVITNLAHKMTDAQNKDHYYPIFQSYDFPFVAGKPMLRTSDHQPVNRRRESGNGGDISRSIQHLTEITSRSISDMVTLKNDLHHMKALHEQELNRVKDHVIDLSKQLKKKV